VNPRTGQSVQGQGDQTAPCQSGKSTGMTWSILAEILQLLENLSATGERGAISLRSLPMTEADRLQLEENLGRGEVHAVLDLAGPTEVWETLYAGVWWVRHKGTDGNIACEEIEIATVPEILKTHPADINKAAGRLKTELDQVRQAQRVPAQNQENEVEAQNV
jgi:hydrogenase-1 operon protein HyaF